MVEIKNVSKAFGEKVVLNDVSAVFEAGKTNLIIGASGSGKTVLQKCMVGLLRPDSGQVLFDGRDLVTMGREEKKELRQQVGMLFQRSALFDSMSVERNIRFPLDMFTKMTRKEKLDRVDLVLERVNLAGTNKKYPDEISGGMMKRVGIARAIVLNPKYLFCDEPNSGLDPQTSLLIDKLIHEITHEFDITTIVNTHDMNSVMGIGENIIYLHQGKKEWEGTHKDIIHSRNALLNNFIFASDFFKDARAMKVLEAEGIVKSGEEAEKIIERERNSGEGKI